MKNSKLNIRGMLDEEGGLAWIEEPTRGIEWNEQAVKKYAL